MDKILKLFVICLLIASSQEVPMQGIASVDGMDQFSTNFTFFDHNYIENEDMDEIVMQNSTTTEDPTTITTTTTTILSAVTKPTVSEKPSYDFFDTIAYCAGEVDVVVCLKEKFIDYLEKVIVSDNISWMFNDYMSVKKDPEFNATVSPVQEDEAENVNDILQNKLEELVESRSFQLNPASEDKPSAKSLTEEGRKKKGGGKKHGNMMMLVGVVVLAMIKQMVLGKIAFLALAAFMLAKVSLLFSSLSVLKKAIGGQQKSEHVVVTSDHSSGSSNGWQRSIQEPDDEDRNANRRHHKPYRGYSDLSMEGAR